MVCYRLAVQPWQASAPLGPASSRFAAGAVSLLARDSGFVLASKSMNHVV